MKVERFLALILIIILLPVFLVLSLVLLIGEGWPILYIQKRVGWKGMVFKMYKFRTMRKGADKQQVDYAYLNEADGPVFKIHNDPRHTKIGRFLFHTGLDELPQLFNIVRGEMSFVGPRPLPVGEEEKIDNKYRKERTKVVPGIVSPWVVEGYHRMSFEEWMKSDVNYVKIKNSKYDCQLLIRSIVMVMKLLVREVFCCMQQKVRYLIH